MDLAGEHGTTESAFLGTASAPVSRTNTRTPEEFVADLQAEQQQNHPGNGNGNGGSVNGSSGSSSGATAVHHSPSSLQSGTTHNGVHNRDFAAASTGGGGGGHAPETHLSLPKPQTEEQLRRALGSASAPASPGGGIGHGLQNAIHSNGLGDGVSPPSAAVAGAPGGSGLPRSSSDPRIEASTSTASEQGMYMTHHDPAVAAGLLDPSLSEPAGQVPPSLLGASPLGRAQTADPATGSSAATTPAAAQQAYKQRRHHHHHHNNNSQYNPYGQESYYAQQGGGYYQHTGRGLGHQNSHHSKPVFSLARPLPTREQRDLQKAYRDGIKNRTGAGKSAHAHSHAHGPTIGPGGRHPQANPGPGAFGAAPLYGHPQHQVMGPGAHHPTGPVAAGQLEPGYATGRPFGEHEQLVAMLRQLLDAQKADDKDETGTKVGAEDEKDVRVDDPDAAMKRKEKFGQNDKDSKAKKTAKAERRDSIGSDGSSSSSSSDEDEEEEFPNPFARFRHAMREPFAEYLGTMLLVMFGTGVSLQYFLSLDPNVVSSPRGTYLSVSFGWGIGVGMGVWVAGGISGGHINPAVTLALAVFRGFPWKKVPGYMLAQVLGSMTGAGLNYAMYRRAISIFEGGGGIRTVTGDTATANLFATYPLEFLTNANAFFSEFINTAVLLIVVLAISDSNNAAPPDGLNPLVLMFLVVGIGACFGMQTAYCINPARDLGPRLVTWFAGYSTEVWNFRHQYWLWVPWLATLSGGLMGALIYDTLIYTGSESPCNIKWDWPWRKRSRESFGPASKAKMPVGQTEA